MHTDLRRKTRPVEFVALRLSAIGVIAKPRTREIEAGGSDASAAIKLRRAVYFAESGGSSTVRYMTGTGYGRVMRLKGRQWLRRWIRQWWFIRVMQRSVDGYGNLFVSSM